MHKVQVVIRPVQLELREGVQARLLRAPIEWAAPIVDEASKITDIRPVEPRLARRRIRKTGARQPFPQVRNIAIGNAQCERLRHRLLPHGIHSDVCACDRGRSAPLGEGLATILERRRATVKRRSVVKPSRPSLRARGLTRFSPKAMVALCGSTT